MEVNYSKGSKFAYIDGLTFTRDERTGYYLSSKNIDGSRKRLHVYVWEKHHGKVPHGYHVHHKFHDKRKNEIEDLQLMSEREHIKHHADLMIEDERDVLRKRLDEKARPKAIEWHGSEDGRKWHSEHAKQQWKFREPIEYECTNCGKKFESRKSYADSSNRFCCNNCKSAWRRKTGVDNERRECKLCGEPFVANRYSNRKRCDKCRHIRDTKGRS